MTEPPPPPPPNSTPIDLEELFATIGELYFQVRQLRKMVALGPPPPPEQPTGLQH